MGSFVVPAELRPWVEEVDVASAVAAVAVDAPDHAVTLVLGTGREVVVMGPRTRATYHVGEPGRSCVRIRLRAGRARTLLGRSVRDLTDRAVSVHELPGLDIDRLADDPVAALTETLAERPVDDDLVGAAAPTC